MTHSTFEKVFKAGILLIVVVLLGIIMHEGIINQGFNSGWGL